MKLINITRPIYLPSIKRNKINHGSHIFNKGTNDELKSNRITRFSLGLKLNNFSNNRRKKSSLKIFTPLRKRLSNELNIFSNIKNFNSFELSNNKTVNKNKSKNIFNKEIFMPNLEIPLLNYKFNIPNNKRIVKLLYNREMSEINKSNYYNYNEDNGKFNIKLNGNKIDNNKSFVNLKKQINYEEKNNYNFSFLSYAYNEFENNSYRKEMEDFHCIKKNLLKKSNNGIIYSFFSIFDGHSGKEVSLYLSQNFHKILSSQLNNIQNFESNEITVNKIISAIKNSFLLIDNKIIKDLSLKQDSGSTGTILLLFNLGEERYMICANIGDSKGYILSKNKKIIHITKEHNCQNQNEVLRVKENGGIVFNNRVYGTLMLTRSFGDKEMKKYGVISSPDTFCHKITENDKFIIIASDGLWDAINEDDIINMGDLGLSSGEFSKKIVKLAIEKGSRDNISCIVIKLNQNKNIIDINK